MHFNFDKWKINSLTNDIVSRKKGLFRSSHSAIKRFLILLSSFYVIKQITAGVHIYTYLGCGSSECFNSQGRTNNTIRSFVLTKNMKGVHCVAENSGYSTTRTRCVSYSSYGQKCRADAADD